MELGNLLFGNSFGEYKIPRRSVFEDEFFKLFETCEPGYNGYHGIYYENDTFFTMPYYWGNCTCGFDGIDNGHEKVNNLEHKDSCYNRKYWKIYDDYLFSNQEERLKELKILYKEYGWNTEGKDWWNGCAIRCSCDYNERIDKISDEYTELFGSDWHTDECLLVKPNFLYKKNGLEVRWYKYPLRDSYSNIKLNLKYLMEVIDDCINSVNKE